MTAVRIGFTQQSEQLLQRLSRLPNEVRTVVSGGLAEGLGRTSRLLQQEYLRGGSLSSPRGGKLPLAARSGALLGSIGFSIEPGALVGYVGALEGTASRYAKVQLGDQTWTMKPTKAKHLWVPIADNLTGGGTMRYSPTWVMSQVDDKGKRLARIFESHNKNLVVFLPVQVGRDDAGNETIKQVKGQYARGKKRGKQRGLLLFVLKDSVTVQGSGALIKAVDRMKPEFAQIIQKRLAAHIERGGVDHG